MNLMLLLYIKLMYKFVGVDGFGNRYYESRRKIKSLGRTHRMVRYAQLNEPSCIPARWHAWVHHQVKSINKLSANEEKVNAMKHHINQTGTSKAYSPIGYTAHRNKAVGDYQRWNP